MATRFGTSCGRRRTGTTAFAGWRSSQARRRVRYPTPTDVSPRFDGRLFDVHGHSMPGREGLLNRVHADREGSRPSPPVRATEQEGLRLWRTPGPPQLSTTTIGLRPNGDIQEPVHILVYACGPGRLELTLFGKQGTPVEIDVDGAPKLRIELPAGSVWNGSVPAPPYADGQTRCVYDLVSKGLVGSTRIEFVRQKGAASRERPLPRRRRYRAGRGDRDGPVLD